MMDTFQPPFETCIKYGDVSSAMCSYNQIYGPTHIRSFWVKPSEGNGISMGKKTMILVLSTLEIQIYDYVTLHLVSMTLNYVV